MKYEAIRSHLDNTRERLEEVLSGLQRAGVEPRDHEPGAGPAAKAAASADTAMRHCEEALRALGPDPREPSDVESVRQQLLAEVGVQIREFSQAHPYGSTVACEDVVDAELEEDEVEIPVETDSLPCWLQGTWTGAGNEVDLEFRLTRVDWNPPAAHNGTGCEFAVYRVEIA